MHLPSAEKLWQIPAFTQFPMPVPSFLLSVPLEVQATSYFAASDKISNFSAILICSVITINALPSFEYTFVFISLSHRTSVCNRDNKNGRPFMHHPFQTSHLIYTRCHNRRIFIVNNSFALEAFEFCNTVLFQLVDFINFTCKVGKNPFSA